MSRPASTANAKPVHDIDDCSLVYGEDIEIDDFGNVIDHCAKAPDNHHVYSIADNFTRCVHCGEESGL